MKNRFFRASIYVLASIAILLAVSFANAADSTSFNPTAITVKVESAGGVPIGGVIPWTSSTPPKDYLECNGQSFSSTTYPKLATALGSNSVPNLSDTFLRGAGGGRAVNSKADATAGVTLTRQTTMHSSSSNRSGRSATISTSGGWSGWGIQAGQGSSHESLGHVGEQSSNWTFGKVRYHLSANNSGGPKNYAVMFVIRAK